MCGIAGIYGQNNDILLNKLSVSMIHRGPDGEGRYLDNDVSMVIRRLAIIDLKTGDQPKFNEDKSIIATFNGEIYNFKELQKILKNLGHYINTNSDTEIIAHSYEEWGVNSFDKFDGMFGIALFDKKKNRFYLVRDQFGIKPLYYVILKDKAKQQVLYSSEIKPILNSGFIKSIPNDKIIYRYLKYRVHDDNKETFFKGIYKLMSGEYLEVNKNKILIKKYSSINENIYKNLKKEQSGTEINTFFKLLKKSVQNRLISDVPVGTCLSGGIDSSTVVSLVNQLKRKHVLESRSLGPNQNVFSAVFPGSINDEEDYIDILLKSITNLNSHKIYPNHKDFLIDIQDFVRTQEEPTISSGPYAQYKVMQKAKEHIKVIIDGQGSDEMLAGYNPYYLVYFKQLIKQKKYLLLLKELLLSGDIIFKIIGNSFKINQYDLINKNFAYKYRKEYFVPTKDNLKKRLYEDVFYNSLPALLRYEDKNAMRFSIEGRIPFCEVNLFKYIFSLDDNFIIKNGFNKFILRKATKGLLPNEIRLRRNKVGFTTPEDEWLLKNYDYVYKIFSSDTFGKRRYFNQLNAVIALKKFKEGKYSDSLSLWRLLNLELWLREFIDSKERKNNLYPILKRELQTKINNINYKLFIFKTQVFKQNLNYVKVIADSIKDILNNKEIIKRKSKKYIIVISEKVIAVSQGRSYFLWDIYPSLFAKMLYRLVSKNPHGIGLRSPWTMELAIKEAGITKVLFAAFISVITKALGIKGIFYKILGRKVASIDGPTSYSIYPSNISAKLGPKDPQKTAELITNKVKSLISNSQELLGVIIIDANDLGQDVLANTTQIPNSTIEKIYQSNPMGQSDEQTPISLVFL
ncbi:MAG: asparagine synthase (glutamine-hydrolyzing) [bacterium]|nr:asparagine synthase (glutamine-hydrolyzing) [bacterium]